MSLIPDEIVEQVRDSADLVGMIGESVELKRTGTDYRGPCPFHGGTHRNFAVIPKKGRYYCFVCHESGDVFSWLMKRFSMDYPTAVRDVARRSGIVIPETTGRAGPDPREPLFGAIAVAHDWFARQLIERRDAGPAREYLESRALPIDTSAEQGLGWAPGGTAFLDAMRTLGVGEPVLLEAGLAARRDDGRMVARFRTRLLFPIHDLRGRLAGFGGRLLGPGEPKYLNSPESPVFQKGRLLYNLHQAKGAIRKEENVIVVEGYFDVLRLVLAGIEHVVAPMGTAMTPDQAALLRRYAPVATLLYDGDQAGLRASFRAGDELLRHSMRIRVATLPPGDDPDTIVRRGGGDALRPVLDDAMDLVERKIQLLDRRGWFEGIEHRRDALDRLLPTIRAAADPISRELYLSRVAERCGVNRDVLERELASGRGAGRPTSTQTTDSDSPVRTRESSPPPPVARVRNNPETRLLQAMLAGPEWARRARDEVDPELITTLRLRELFTALVAAPEAAGAQLPSACSEEAQAAWVRLKESAVAFSRQDVGTIYDTAVQILRARPDYRRLHDLDPLERWNRRSELRERFPEADQWYHWMLRKTRRT
ncbi:MAG: DNA primase [Gemmatimonadales bacterium]|nr:DNA primase [Gemmatimonadales bacterium]